MLTLDLGLSRSQKIIRLGKVRKSFATYFGFTSDERIADALLYQNGSSGLNPLSSLTTVTTGQELRTRFGIGRGDPIARRIVEIFMEGDGTALLGISDANDPDSIANKLSQLIHSSPPPRQTNLIISIVLLQFFTHRTDLLIRLSLRLE